MRTSSCGGEGVRLEIRKLFTVVEEIRSEAGVPADLPLRKAAAAAVVRNPFAGRYEPDLRPLIEASREIGALLGGMAVSALASPVESYGKGGIAGLAGEQEHANAMLTTVFGDALRRAVGGGKAWIPSVTKRDVPGAAMDVPLAYKDALWVRSHYDAISVRIADAPLPEEIVVIAAVANRGRLNARVGGLRKEEVKGEDGLR